MDANLSSTADELLATCQAARKAGADFPAIWRDILNKHRLVAGIPIQVTITKQPMLEIPLVLAQMLISNSNGFSLK